MKSRKSLRWSIREGVASDLDAIRALYVKVWGHQRPLSYDRWRFLRSSNDMCPATLAVEGDRLVGAYFTWPTRFRIGTETLLGGQAMDVMTDPDHAGEGMFEQLVLANMETIKACGIEVCYGFPNSSSFPGFVQRLNWDHTGDIMHWIRPIRPSGHMRMPWYLGIPADVISRLLPQGSRAGYQIVIGRPPADELETILARWRRRKRLNRVERDLAWFDWRYAPESLYNYEWVSAYIDGKLAAFGIWGMRGPEWDREADRRGHLTELMGAEKKAIQAVLSTIVERAANSGAILLETVSSQSELRTILKRSGFISHRPIPFIVRGLTTRNLSANIHSHRGWQLVGGDVDTF